VDMLAKGQYARRMGCCWDILRWDVVKAIIPHSPKATTDSRNIVWLGRVGHCAILSKTNSLLGELVEDRLGGGTSRDERKWRKL
jgi:hypothetical protein